jgi:GTP diphosphokinase / guanosine-3',5'-bis(diphosphate) 3'-diphosphatase
MIPTMTETNSFESLLVALSDFSPTERALVERAYARAAAAHDGQYRKSGEPFITHCLAVAHILADLKLDAETISAGLLHDTVEDCDTISLDDIRREFGETVATIVDGVTKLEKVKVNTDIDTRKRTADKETEYIRKMLLGMGDDMRVVLVKLADRLHNMRTLGYMKPEKQRRIAQETLDIFAPLANRLGIWQIKWELEDLSFRYLDPEAYKTISTQVDELRRDRESYMKGVIKILRDALAKAGIHHAEISGRPKAIYSIYKKMNRKDVPFDQVYDVRAVRVIVDTVPECYHALGIVHSMWRPIEREFDDYIAAPKDNFYQSLHTAVRDTTGKTVEVQIRTRAMHEHAEYGVAAHWRYKEGKNGARDEVYEKRIEYMRRLMEDVRKAEDATEFMENMKNDVFKDRVIVVTPKGDAVDLAAGATPIDFAYHVHTDLGHRCRGARVNGAIVPLNYVLKSGDQVEIIAMKQGGPSLDWLNSDLGYVNTSRARSKIKYWFRKQNRERTIAEGRNLLERELRKLGLLSRLSLEQVAGYFGQDSLEELLVAIGSGEITGRELSARVLQHENPKVETKETEVTPIKTTSAPLLVNASNGVSIGGMGGMLVNLAKCCSPVPGDAIIGYTTRGRGVTVHRLTCPNVNMSIESGRYIDAQWGTLTKEQFYPVPLEIISYDRDGLLRDITTLIADERINISSVKVDTQQDIATIHLTLQLVDLTQVARILSRIERVNSVVEVRRRVG